MFYIIYDYGCEYSSVINISKFIAPSFMYYCLIKTFYPILILKGIAFGNKGTFCTLCFNLKFQLHSCIPDLNFVQHQSAVVA